MNTIDKILVPIDESNASYAALREAFGVAERYGADVDVLHAWDVVIPPQGIPPAFPPMAANAEGFRAAAEHRLQAVVGAIEPPPGVTVKPLLERGPPKDRILEHASRVDLVVMATSGRTGLERLLLGSTTEQVVRRAACPVLTLRPDGDEDVSEDRSA